MSVILAEFKLFNCLWMKYRPVADFALKMYPTDIYQSNNFPYCKLSLSLQLYKISCMFLSEASVTHWIVKVKGIG